MKTLFLNLLLFFIFIPQLFAQTILEPNGKVEMDFDIYKKNVLDKSKFVWGYSLGLTVDFNNKRNSTFRLFLSSSIAKNLIQANTVGKNGTFNTLGALQTELEFFRGGLGTCLLNDERAKINIEMRVYPQLFLGLDHQHRLHGRPMNISIGQSMSTLFDPFDNSLSFGICFINGLNHKRNQQLGFLMLGIHNFQAFYANDGPPFGKIGLGDKFDRLWTGSGQVGWYSLNDSWFLTDFVLRYDKYTGYQPHIYELGFALQVDNLPYRDTEIQYFTQSRFQLRLGIRNTLHINASLFNPNFDIQDLIHYEGTMPYHVTPMEQYLSFGTDYQYRRIQISN